MERPNEHSSNSTGARRPSGHADSVPSSRRGLVVLGSVLTLAAMLGGYCGSSAKATATTSEDIEGSVKNFTRVLSVVERNYVHPVDTERAIYDGAIPGMLEVLDPHSLFFDPKQWAAFREEQEGRYYGIGMVVMSNDNQTEVQYPFVSSPALRAGIRPGDVVLAVNGKSCAGLTTSEVANMLKGARGTSVHISLGREGWEHPIEVTVVRDEISHPAVEYSTIVKPGVGYVRIWTFSETTDSDLASALKQLDASKLDGLILDLRNNGGGLVNQAVGMADMFLDKGELVVSHRGRESAEQSYYAPIGNRGLTVPLVVLVNGQSASASEIVSGAIQDHDRGLIVGQTTFGKGLVGAQIGLSEDTALMLMIARYYTPSGRLIQREYKNQTLYDYHYNPQPPQRPDVKLTDTGRQVYGEGGITPDVMAAEPKLTAFEELLERRGVFYPLPQGVGDFVRFYLGEQPQITKKFVVDDSVIRELQKFLDRQHLEVSDQQVQAELPWLRWQIKREVFTTVFGVNDGFKVALENDPQLDKAVESLPQAKALYAGARKILAERQSDAPIRP